MLALSGGGDGAAAAAAALPPALPSAAWPAFARARACTEHARALARAGAAVPALRERAVGVGALASLVRAVGWPLGERVRALRRVASASLRALDAALRRGEAGSEVVAAAARSALSDAAEPQLAAAVAVARAVAAAPTLRIAPLDAPPASMLDAAADAAAAAAADAACVQLDSAATQTAALLDAAAAVHTTLAELRAVAADAPRTPMPPDAALAAASALAADIAALRCLWRGLAAWHLASAACKRAPAGAQPLAEVPRHSLALDAAAQAALRTADAYEEAAAAAAGSGAGDASSALPPAAAACSWLRAQAAGLHAALPAVEALRSTELRPRHWQVLEAAFADDGGDAAAIGNTAAALAAVAPPPLAEQPLGMLLARGLLARAPQVLAIAAAARAEAELEAAVEEHVTAAWAARELTWGLAPTAEAAAAAAAAAAASPPPTVAAASAPIVLTNVDGTGGVRAALDASLAMLADTLASAACGMHLRPAAEAAQRRLALAAATLDAWLAAQRKWAALAPALADADAHMRHALPDACARFGAVDRALRALMRRTAANPNVLATAAAKGLREALARHADTLDDVQAQLDAWRAAQAQPPQAQPASSSLA